SREQWQWTSLVLRVGLGSKGATLLSLLVELTLMKLIEFFGKVFPSQCEELEGGRLLEAVSRNNYLSRFYNAPIFKTRTIESLKRG
ncbi:hypothetical protein CR513_32310, partial [Mucuna pruriens]